MTVQYKTDNPPLNTTPSKVVNELTLIFGSVHAALAVVASSTLLADLPKGVTLTVALASLVVGAVQIGLKNYAQSKVVAAEEAVEVRSGDEVIAGPANDLKVTGETVRTLNGNAGAPVH